MQVYERDGKFLQEFIFPNHRVSPHFFFTLDGDGNIWISKGGYDRIQVHTPDGKFNHEVILPTPAPAFFAVTRRHIIAPVKHGSSMMIYNLQGKQLSQFSGELIAHGVPWAWTPSSVSFTSDERRIVVTVQKSDFDNHMKIRPHNVVQIFKS